MRPLPQGLGTMMLTGILAQEIGGTVSLEEPAQGLVSRIRGKLESDG
jgi:hypothetical protein